MMRSDHWSMLKKFSFLLSGVLALSGCKMIPRYERPAPRYRGIFQV